MKNTVIVCVRAMFSHSQDYGCLTVGAGFGRRDIRVTWDTQSAEELAQECGALVDHLTALALRGNSGTMTKAQREVWDTYLRPFPDHDLDAEMLQNIREKEALGVPYCALDAGERQLSCQYDAWYEKQALTRLPWKCCSPTDLIRCARRYARLVQLDAPAPVQANEARCLAEEFVLYHCMQ